MTKRLNLKKLLAAALLLIGVAFVQTAFAQTTWSVSITDTGNPCKFKIERTGDISQAVTVKYRTVSLSAFEGQHFTAVSGDVTFQPDDYEKFIDVAESTPIDSAYMFQNGTSRSYRFEVTDMGGFYLAHCYRTKTTGTSVPSSGAFAVKNVTINSGEITVTHGGYGQALHSMTVGNYFNNAAPRPYLQYIGAQLHMTLSFQCKEIDDGWQYVQIYANQETSNIDPGGDGGNPGACSFSKYAAGFEHKHGSKDAEYKSYTFPVTTVGDNTGATDPWGHGNQYNLYLQNFNNSRASDGRLIIPTNLTSLYIRYNASGSGGDDWVAKNTVAHIQAMDGTAPTISTNSIKVAGGIYGYGNTVYISVPFTEIVTVSGTPTLSTTWGELSYTSGSGSNVLTFSGTITANVGTSLTVSSINGTVKDLAGNSYNTNTAIGKSFNLTVERPWPGSGSQSDPYIITNTTQLNCLAYEVRDGNSYHGTYFKLGADIDMNGADFLGIGHWDYAFSGTFDGDGKTVSNVVVNMININEVGFFGRLSDATVKNLVLDNISISGTARVGILAGRADNSSIENCLVMNSNVKYYTSINYVGIIAGYPDDSDFSANYYHGCTLQELSTPYATVNMGVGRAFTSPYDIDGARSVHTLTLPEYVTATSAETVTYNQVTYYASNVSVTLTPDQGFTLEDVSVNGTTATKNSDGTWSFIMPAEDATVTALMSVPYIDENGDEQTCTDFTAVGSSYVFGDWNGQATLGVDDNVERWYAVVGTVSLDKPLNVYGNARLILCDGAALNINAVYDYAAFNIPASNGSDFTIYGQAQGTGTLRVTNTRGRAIDIKKNTTINGGSVIASSKHSSIGISGTLTINRGTVTATSARNGIYVSGTITQNGGTLNATGDDSGIQLGRGTLTQNGGTLNATGSATGNYTTNAGIYAHVSSTVNILGGTLSATGTGGAYGIHADFGSTVNIFGGIVTATGDIGIYADDSFVYILGGIVNATGSTYGIDVISYNVANFEPNITLGWTTPDDRITASSIHLHNRTKLQVRDGQTLTDGEGGLYSGIYETLSDNNACDAMAGKTLQPAYRLTLSGTDFTVTGTTAHQGYAPAGEVVTLHTDEGYHITSASYTPESGSAIDITPVGDVWSFTMPSEDATVSATTGLFPWAGSGDSEDDPYLILYATQLVKLAEETYKGNDFSGKFFKLGNDIDMNGVDFLGIGHGNYAFSGTFDGDGKTVSNVVVNTMNTNDVGFFGRLSGATVKNLVLDNISISGTDAVGILAGRADNSSIENCLVLNSNVSSNDSNNPHYVGIIAGYPVDSYFSANYYHGCTYCGTANATNVGVGREFNPYDIAGARSVHRLTLPEYVIATSAETVTYNQVTYYASNVSVTLTPDQGFTLEYVSVNGTAATEGSDGTWGFTMPAEDATVTALMGVLYIDENGNEQTCTDYTVVSSSYVFGDYYGTATIGVDDDVERWYAVVGTVSLDKPLMVNGNARLILCDGAALNINADIMSGTAFGGSNHGLTIYGQARQTGTLSVTNTGGAIYVNTFTVNGGTVIATGGTDREGILISNGILTINRGSVTATGAFGVNLKNQGTLTQNGGTLSATGSGIYNAGINNVNATVNILGGTFSATGTDGAYGIYADERDIYATTVTLGWTNPDDRITASSIYLYGDARLQVRDGQTLADGEGGLYSGTYVGDFDGYYVMAGKTLRGCIVREVVGYGSSTTNGWNLIASPVGTVNLADVPHLFDNRYDLYYFDQTGGSNGKEWKNHKAHCSDAENPFNAMVGGQGYLYANSKNVTLLFMGAPYNGDGEVTLTKADGFELSGWNLIGNPFNTAATLDKPFYRMNESGSALTAQVEANNSVAAMEGVFVQASTHNETATFTPLASPSRGDHRGGVPMLNIHLSQNRGEVIDNAILRFDDGQTLEKFSFRKDSPKIYLPQGGKDYAIATVGRDAARHVSTNEVPVNFDAKENGTYTLSVNVDGVELEYLHLIDNLTGADVDLLTSPEYTFTAKTTDYPSRFKLVFSAASTGSAADEAFAYIDASGNIIITADAHGASLQVIDMMGHINVSIDGNTRCVPTAGMTPGVYVLRLIDGENVRTQKIVID